ncbi:hypothetical protein [Pseudoalteromonas sp. SWYJZ12]|uniref:hypothetical protein n=1 Tax=Pseudoalteromonas sp. SWYJZ12 TaxID=2792067 RepID=UPI0018CE572E|nr:hypothetical protein [Pseudoalteromonas sp. SWYJZ12]MBH0002711.1 hypothetical protein [Pseudoalteromonas sp. SWYJZ12]
MKESANIRDIGVFNNNSLDVLALNWKRAEGVGNNQLDEVVSWLASLDNFIQSKKLPKLDGINLSNTLTDYYNTFEGAGYGALYVLARNVFKR